MLHSSCAGLDLTAADHPYDTKGTVDCKGKAKVSDAINLVSQLSAPLAMPGCLINVT